jgi:hypothetical protein
MYSHKILFSEIVIKRSVYFWKKAHTDYICPNAPIPGYKKFVLRDTTKKNILHHEPGTTADSRLH